MIKLSGELTTFGWGFYEQTKLKTITIPNSVTSIGENAFYDCTELTSINIPNSVTTIGASVFNICTELTSINIPASVTSIGNDVFTGCTGLSHIVVDSNNQKYDSRNDCNAIIETATNTLVYGCKNTVIPNTVTTIDDSAFQSQTSLTDITIPNSVTTIGDGAFSGCRGLVTLTVPNTVTNIGYGAFQDIPNVIYSGSATGSPWGANAINGCVDGDFVYTDNIKTNLVAYIGDGGSVIIPNSVTTISNNIIFNHTTLTSIDYGNGLTSIPNLLLSVGTRNNLTSVIIRSNSETINNGIFRDCVGLSSVILENGVTNIGGSVFFGCTALTNITIPNSVTNIGIAVFRNCTSLTSITCNATTPPTLGTVAFDNTNNCPIYVPSGSVEAYKTATNWSSYADRIQAITQ